MNISERIRGEQGDYLDFQGLHKTIYWEAQTGVWWRRGIVPPHVTTTVKKVAALNADVLRKDGGTAQYRNEFDAAM
ncbi:MAG: hypothetical protein EA399_09315 [Desulfovibrionales bacterium]|nr:MAG: hypothetical protein EA399_09315 [Desulfovibrionales bacterium]